MPFVARLFKTRKTPGNSNQVVISSSPGYIGTSLAGRKTALERCKCASPSSLRPANQPRTTLSGLLRAERSWTLPRFILPDAIDQILESFEALCKRSVVARRKRLLSFLCPLVFDGAVFDRVGELIAKQTGNPQQCRFRLRWTQDLAARKISQSLANGITPSDSASKAEL